MKIVRSPASVVKFGATTLDYGRWTTNSGAQNNLHTLILLVFEDFVALRRIAQLHTVGDEKTEVDLALLDSFHEWLHITQDIGSGIQQTQAEDTNIKLSRSPPMSSRDSLCQPQV